MVLLTPWGIIATELLKHVLDGHEFDEKGIVELVVLPLDGVILSAEKLIVFLAIDDWEVRRLHQFGKLRFTGSKVFMGHLTVFDDSFPNFLKEVNWLFLWDFAEDLIGQLLEVEQLVNELKSTLDVTFEFGICLFFEVDLLALQLILSSLKLVREQVNLLVQVIDGFTIFLRILTTFEITNLFLQSGVFFFFDAELVLQVVDFCVLLFVYLLVTEQSSFLLKQSLFGPEFIELLLSLSNDGCFSFGDL